MRPSTAVVEQLTSVATLERVLSHYGSVRREGTWIRTRCVAHEEKTASLKWKPGDKRAHCFGCGADLDVFQIVMRAEGVDEDAAFARVKELCEAEWAGESRAVGGAFKDLLQEGGRTFSVEKWARWASRVWLNEEVIKYLRSTRGLTDDTIRRFMLVAVPDGSRIPSGDHAACPWVGIPTIRGAQIVGVKWRDVRHKNYTQQAGMRGGLFNAQFQPDIFGDLLLTSGEFDCMVLEQAGFRAVSLQSDTRPPALEERDYLRAAGRLVLAGDSDAPGRKAMNKLGIELGTGRILNWPDAAKDANEFYLQDPMSFRDRVRGLLEGDLSLPMVPGFFSLSEKMGELDDKPLSDDPDRFMFPWPAVDEMAIILPGHAVTIASTYTGTGKSTFALQSMLYNATHYSVERRKVPCVYAAEQTPEDLARMSVACLTGADKNHLRKEDIERAREALSDARFFLGFDAGKTTAKEVISLCEQAVKHLGATDLIIDNMGFIGRTAHGNLWEAQAEAMKILKTLAMSMAIRVWVLTAARKAPGGVERYREMEMSDIFGTQAFEADADHVITLHRDLVRKPDESTTDLMSPVTWVNRKKSRNAGPGGPRARLLLLGRESRFTDRIQEVPE